MADLGAILAATLICPPAAHAEAASRTPDGSATGGGGAAISSSELPADPNAGIRVGTGADAVRVILPANAAAGPAQRVGEGQVVYDGADADTAVLADTNGVTIATIAPAAGRAEQRFRYRLDVPDGHALIPQADGSIDIRSKYGDDVAATIEAPWAKDSTGRSLSTSYHVDGMGLTQTVNTVGAVGTVTADPHLVPHGPKVTLIPPSVSPPYLTLWLTRHETEEVYRDYRDTVGTAQAAAASFCAVIGALANVSPPTKAIITVVCAAIPLYVTDLKNNLEEAHTKHTCLNVDVKPPNIGLDPLSLLAMVEKIVKGELPVLDFDDGDGADCEH